MNMRHYCYSTKSVAVEVVRSSWILKVESIGYIGGLDLGCKRDRRIKDDPMIIRLGHRKNGVAIN